MDVGVQLAAAGSGAADLNDEVLANDMPPMRELVRAALAQCQQRRRLLPELALEDPRWLMALDLLLGVEEGRPVTVTNLAIAAEVPFTTALRHISAMVKEGLVHRVAHPTDGRVVYVQLSPILHDHLVDYLKTVDRLGEGLRTTGSVERRRVAAPPADSDERPEPRAPESILASLPGWECVARTNGRFISTILTRDDVSIALVFPEADARRAENVAVQGLGKVFPAMATDEERGPRDVAISALRPSQASQSPAIPPA